MPVDEFLNFRRIDVFTAANDELLTAPDNAEVAVRAAAGEVARVEPAVAVDDAGGGFRVLVVAGHHAMAADTKLSRLAIGNFHTSCRINDANLESRERMPHRPHANLDRIV